MRNMNRWSGLRCKHDTAADAPIASTEPQRVDVELVIRAARLAVTTRAATQGVFVRQLEVTPETADQLLARLEHCDVVGPDEPGQRRRVRTTSAQLPGIIEEFRRRG